MQCARCSTRDNLKLGLTPIRRVYISLHTASSGRGVYYGIYRQCVFGPADNSFLEDQCASAHAHAAKLNLYSLTG